MIPYDSLLVLLDACHDSKLKHNDLACTISILRQKQVRYEFQYSTAQHCTKTRIAFVHRSLLTVQHTSIAYRPAQSASADGALHQKLINAGMSLLLMNNQALHFSVPNEAVRHNHPPL